MPIKPITTEGMVAKTSIIGFSNSLIGLGASSPIYIAAPTPKGSAMIIAPIVTIVEPKSKGSNPYFSVEVGAHFVPLKKSKTGYCVKNLKELYIRKIRIRVRTKIDINPFKKMNLVIKKDLNLLNFDFKFYFR